MERPTLLLIHGSWAGAWTWERLTPELESRNLRWRAIDLPGCGNDRRLGWRVSLGDYASAIADPAREVGGPVIVVGHSAGGIAISQAAANFPGNICALVYLAAFLPINGDRLIQLSRKIASSEFQKAIKPKLSSGHLTLSIDKSRDLLFHDCAQDDVDFALKRQGPEPMRPGITKIKLGADFHQIRKHYLHCTDDRVILPDMQKWMAERHAIESQPRLKSGHMPMFSAPSALAKALEEIVAKETGHLGEV